jgi:hypothetical protein
MVEADGAVRSPTMCNDAKAAAMGTERDRWHGVGRETQYVRVRVTVRVCVQEGSTHAPS